MLDHIARAVNLDATGIVIQGVVLPATTTADRAVAIVRETLRRAVWQMPSSTADVTVLSAGIARGVSDATPAVSRPLVQPMVAAVPTLASDVSTTVARNPVPGPDERRDLSERRHAGVPPASPPHSVRTTAVTAVASAAAAGGGVGVGAALAVLGVCIAALTLIGGALASAPAVARSVSLLLVVERPD